MRLFRNWFIWLSAHSIEVMFFSLTMRNLANCQSIQRCVNNFTFFDMTWGCQFNLRPFDILTALGICSFEPISATLIFSGWVFFELITFSLVVAWWTFLSLSSLICIWIVSLLLVIAIVIRRVFWVLLIIDVIATSYYLHFILSFFYKVHFDNYFLIKSVVSDEFLFTLDVETAAHSQLLVLLHFF